MAIGISMYLTHPGVYAYPLPHQNGFSATAYISLKSESIFFQENSFKNVATQMLVVLCRLWPNFTGGLIDAIYFTDVLIYL